METRFEASSCDHDALREIVDAVHDQWFNLSDIRHDKDIATLTIQTHVPLRSRSHKRRRLGVLTFYDTPLAPAKLILTGVQRLMVNDNSGTGRADINDIVLTDQSCRITCGIPLEVIAEGTRLKLALVIQDIGPTS